MEFHRMDVPNSGFPLMSALFVDRGTTEIDLGLCRLPYHDARFHAVLSDDVLSGDAATAAVVRVTRYSGENFGPQETVLSYIERTTEGMLVTPHADTRGPFESERVLVAALLKLGFVDNTVVSVPAQSTLADLIRHNVGQGNSREVAAKNVHEESRFGSVDRLETTIGALTKVAGAIEFDPKLAPYRTTREMLLGTPGHAEGLLRSYEGIWRRSVQVGVAGAAAAAASVVRNRSTNRLAASALVGATAGLVKAELGLALHEAFDG